MRSINMRKTVLMPIAHAAHQVRSVYSTCINMILHTVLTVFVNFFTNHYTVSKATGIPAVVYVYPSILLWNITCTWLYPNTCIEASSFLYLAHISCSSQRGTIFYTQMSPSGGARSTFCFCSLYFWLQYSRFIVSYHEEYTFSRPYLTELLHCFHDVCIFKNCLWETT